VEISDSQKKACQMWSAVGEICIDEYKPKQYFTIDIF